MDKNPFNGLKYVLKTAENNIIKTPKILTLSIGDIVATQAKSGHDIGMVTLTGELVRVQMKRKKISEDREKS